MNPKEIAEELIIKMINAADRKQTQRVRERFADVVFVDHSSLNGMRGALVSADEFVTSWRQLPKDAQTYASLSNFELLPAQEGISAERHAHMVCTAPDRGRYSGVRFLRYLGSLASTGSLRFSSSPPCKGATKTSQKSYKLVKNAQNSVKFTINLAGKSEIRFMRASL